MILYTEGRTDAQASESEKVMHLLCAAYPGHPWAVRVDDGIIFIRHLAFGTNWGMNLKTKEADHDIAVMNKKIVTLAGEWLERAGMRRGRYDADQEITHVEGLPQHQQPHQPLPENFKIVTDSQMRETPRPQVNKLG